MVRFAMVGLAAVLAAGAANAQDKIDPIPAPRPVPVPMPPVGGAPKAGPADVQTGLGGGTLWSPYHYQKYPVPGQIVVVPGNAYAYLPARAVYGPAASPNDFPYGSFLPGHTGETYINPYPRTASKHYHGSVPFPARRWR
jgi:hypothetical protein